MLLGCCEDEYGVLWWLLQSLEEGVERRRGEHMHLVDNEHRVAPVLWYDTHLLYEVADVVNRVVRRSIQLVDVERATLVERAARLTLVASLCPYGVKAVYSLGKYAGASGFTHATRTAEEVCVSQLISLNGILERRCNMLLSDH